MEKYRNNYLQGYRAIACIMVFLGHALGMYVTRNNGKTFLHLFSDGSIAVKMFWVLGGYLAALSYNDSSIKNYIYYVTKKMIRLYPAYIISIILGSILCNLQLDYDSGIVSSWCGSFWNSEIGMDEIMRQSIFRGNANLINPPIWTMKYEVCMVFILPLVISIVSRRKHKICLGMCVFICAAISGIIYQISQLEVLAIFGLGVLLGLGEKIIDLSIIERWKWIIFGVALLLLNCRNISYLDIIDICYKEYITAIGAMLILKLLIIEFYPLKILGSRVFCFVGNLSYEIYLFHFPILLFLRHWFNNEKLGYILIFFSLVITIILSLPIHYLSVYFYDKLRDALSRKVFKC